MKKKLRLALAVLAVASSLFTAQPAQATDSWWPSDCRHGWYWADNHWGGYNYWHHSWDWNFNGYTVDNDPVPMMEIYESLGWECGIGGPIGPVGYVSNGDYWRQVFSCGEIHYYYIRQVYRFFGWNCMY